LFADVVFGNETAEMYLIVQNIFANSVEDSMYIQRESNQIKFVGWNGFSLNWVVIGGSYSIGQRVKIAAAYKLNDIVLYINGVQIGIDTSATIPPTTSLAIGYFPATPSVNSEKAKQINQAVLFKTRLTNAELASLTTI
jgi:hypothetical protein